LWLLRVLSCGRFGDWPWLATASAVLVYVVASSVVHDEGCLRLRALPGANKLLEGVLDHARFGEQSSNVFKPQSLSVQADLHARRSAL
jgi:hypothetical protein